METQGAVAAAVAPGVSKRLLRRLEVVISDRRGSAVVDLAGIFGLGLRTRIQLRIQIR